MKLLDSLLLNGLAAILFIAMLVAAYLVYTDPLGHAYLCEVPGSKVCS